jgi:hypothetical protein
MGDGMRRRPKVLVILVGLIMTLSLVPASDHATAQVLPPLPIPPIPAPPAEALPVLEVLGPVVSTACANGQAVLVLGLLVGGAGLSSLPVEIDLLGTVGPVFTVCGVVPTPGERYRCISDDFVQGLGNLPVQLALGLPLPLDLSLLSQLVGTTYEVQDLLPPLADLGLGELGTLLDTVVSSGLSCTTVQDEEDPPPTTQPSVDDGDDVDLGAGFEPPALSGDLPSLVDAVPEESMPLPAGTPVVAAPIASVFSFRYPVVFLLPLLLLGIAAFLGRAFTRQLDDVGRRRPGSAS